MKVNELIEALQQMEQEANVIMFDGPAYYTPSQVYKADKSFKSPEFKDCVVID